MIPLSHQAAAVWNWVGFLRRASDRNLLLLNLDETGVSLFNGDKAGTVARRIRRADSVGDGHQLVQYATTAESRGQATHVAIICDDASVQPHLPQVIIGPSNLLTVRSCNACQEGLADNVHLFRLKSRWTDQATLSIILRSVAQIVREVCPEKQPVMLLDTAPSHMHPTLPALARRHGMHLVFIPARTTWLLQPLDVCVFRKYKHAFRESWLRAKLDTIDGRLEPVQFWSCLCRHVDEFMRSNDWSTAFAKTGFGLDFDASSRSLRACLQLPPAWSLPPLHEPTAADLDVMLPRNRAQGRRVQWLPRIAQLRIVAPAASGTAPPLRASESEPPPLPPPPGPPPPCLGSSDSAPSASSTDPPLRAGRAPLPPLEEPALPPPPRRPLTRSQSRLLALPPPSPPESDQPLSTVTPPAPPAMSAPAVADAGRPISARTRSKTSASSTGS